MALIEVERADDARLAPFRLDERGLANRAQRRDDRGVGWFLAEGDLVCERALEAGCRPVMAMADPHRLPPVARALAADVDVYLGGDDVRRMVTRLGMPHPVIALFERPPRPSVAELVERSTRIVVVEAVDNPANVGAIVRNAAALGWDALVLDHTSADPLSRRSLRVAMGTAFALPHARTRDLAAELGSWSGRIERLALTPAADADDIAEIAPHVVGARAVVVGSERSGLSDDVLAAADRRVRIPMAPGVDSLNAAAATAVACYALR